LGHSATAGHLHVRAKPPLIINFIALEAKHMVHCVSAMLVVMHNRDPAPEYTNNHLHAGQQQPPMMDVVCSRKATSRIELPPHDAGGEFSRHRTQSDQSQHAEVIADRA